MVGSKKEGFGWFGIGDDFGLGFTAGFLKSADCAALNRSEEFLMLSTVSSIISSVPSMIPGQPIPLPSCHGKAAHSFVCRTMYIRMTQIFKVLPRIKQCMFDGVFIEMDSVVKPH